MRLRAVARYPIATILLAIGLVAAPRSLAGQGTGFNPSLPLTHVDNGPNTEWAQSQHYVVLVSLDGFRWDCAKRDNATHLLALGKRGVWAPEGMLPSYPSLTFSQPLHDRHRALPRAHRAGRKYLLRSSSPGALLDVRSESCRRRHMV